VPDEIEALEHARADFVLKHRSVVVTRRSLLE
jgi:hypothetical protein